MPVAATLVSDLSVAEMAAVDTEWLPFLQRAVADAVARGVSRYDLPEHKHWEWERKGRAMGSESAAFGVVAGSEMQAVMIVRTDKTCRLLEQSGEPMVYVDYLATAPWNLAGMVAVPRYKKCGRRLIQAAIGFSIDLGFGGRVGLHSLEQSESFYISQFGMQDLGSDPTYENLHYLELTAGVAISQI